MPCAGDPFIYLQYSREHSALLDNPPAVLEDALVHPHLLIVGPAGCGKSAFLRHVSFLWCSGLEDARTYSLLFPIFIRLPELAKHLESPEPLVDLLAIQSREWHWGLSPAYFREKLAAAFLLLDGLSEVSNDAQCQAIRRVIEGAAVAYSQTRIVVATRPPADALAGFRTVVV